MIRRRWARLAGRGREAGGGGQSLELLMLAPLLLGLMLLIIAAGRYTAGSGKAGQIAGAAARAASLQATPAAADSAAQAQAAAAATDAGLSCRDLRVRVDAGGFTAPPGTPAAVRVSVSCTVSWSDLSIPGMPGSRTLTATAVSPIDIHQEGRGGT